MHSVDRLKVARRLAEARAGEKEPLNICLQVNISGEESKSGVDPADLAELAREVMKLPNLVLRGLMAIPAASADPERQRAQFRALRLARDALRADLAGPNPGLLDTLSMGMSADLEAAIAEGATMVRIGTDIFGPRGG